MSLRLVPPGKRKNKVYYARGTIDGRRIEQSLETSIRAVALTKLRDLEIELENERRHGPRTTFAEAAERYMQDGGEKRYMIPVLKYLGNTVIDDITPQVIAEAARALYPKVKPQTRHRQAVTPIRAVLGHHERGGLRQAVPDEARVRWLTPEEAEHFISCAEDPRAYRLIMTLLGTGCRTSELVKLHTENINIPTAQAFIADPKNNRPRWAPIERNRSLPALLDGLPEQGAAFRTPKGEAYKIRSNNSGGQFAVMFNRVRELAGMEDITPHVLRHTWATWYYAATHHNLAALMNAGGWAKTDMAMRYTKLAPADLAERLRKYGWNFQIGGYRGEANSQGGLRAV